MTQTTKPVNLQQLQDELVAASIEASNGLISTYANGVSVIQTAGADGAATDLPAEAQSVVDAHAAMRDKTDQEYAAEFQDAATSAARKQEIRDITAGLLPREQVPMTQEQWDQRMAPPTLMMAP